MKETFQERLARIKAEQEARKGGLTLVKPEPAPAAPVTDERHVEHDADLIPDVEPGYERNETDEEIDRLIDGIDILDGYRKWCGKMEPKVGKKRESIMVSCPKPEHRDSNPSAWLNLDKDTWFCGSCQEGGDKFDIAAFHYGFPVPGYKDGKNFPDLRRRIAEDLGYVIKKTLGGQEYVERIETETDEAEATPDEVTPEGVSESTGVSDHESVTTAPSRLSPDDEPVATITALPSVLDEVLEYPEIDWYAITPPDSFLRRWMEATSKDDLPDEFYFWLGMQALGLAAGRNTTMADYPPVNGNLFVCLFGPSGQGKSRAQRALTDLLYEALPYDHDDPASTGTYIVPSPGSAEALVDSFSKPIYDPSDPKKLLGHGLVRGLVRFDELSTLTGRSARSGSVMKPQMMALYDGEKQLDLKSRGAGHVIAFMPFASCVTSTQPKAIRDLLVASDADSGFLNRWIFATGREKPAVWYGRKPLDISPCVPLLRAVRGWCGSVSSIPMSEEAERLWWDFAENVYAPARREEDQSLLTRCDLHIKKIMLLFAIDRKETVISAQTAADAISLWEYLRRSYKMLGGEIGMGPLEDARVVVMDTIRRYEMRHKKAISRRELRNLIAHSKKVNIENYVRVLKLLVEVGDIEEVIVKTGSGKSTERYKIASGE